MNQLAVINQMNINDLGQAFVKSGFFSDARDASQAIVKVLAGQELGFGPVASMTGINIIKGRVAIGANLLGAAIKRHPSYNYRIKHLDNTSCTIFFFEDGKEVGESTFTIEDAKTAGLTNKDNWKNYPRNMFFSRALSNGARWYCPDVFGGPIYTPEELGAEVDGETGEVITIEFEPEKSKSLPREQKPSGDEKPSEEAWAKFYELVTEADGYGITVPEPPDDITLATLRSIYAEVKEQLEKKKLTNAPEQVDEGD